MLYMNNVPSYQLNNWNIYKFPMNRKFNYELRSSARVVNKPGIIFRGNFMISQAASVVPGDTFIDFSNYTQQQKEIIFNVDGRLEF